MIDINLLGVIGIGLMGLILNHWINKVRDEQETFKLFIKDAKVMRKRK